MYFLGCSGSNIHDPGIRIISKYSGCTIKYPKQVYIQNSFFIFNITIANGLHRNVSGVVYQNVRSPCRNICINACNVCNIQFSPSGRPDYITRKFVEFV